MNRDPHLTIDVYSNRMNRCIDLYIERYIPEKQAMSTASIVWNDPPAGTHIQSEPALRIHQDHAQRLMDSLWGCGLRPTDGEGTAGQLDATRQHLSDMRKIAFGTLTQADVIPKETTHDRKPQ